MYMNAEEKVVDTVTVALNVLTAGSEIQSNPKSFREISIIPLPFHQKNNFSSKTREPNYILDIRSKIIL